MTVYIKELKQALKAWCIWTISISFMLVVCVFMFPEMKEQMNSVTDMFANMGSFTSAFGMDKLNFGEAIGFYGVECGNILGIGGGFFSAITGIAVLASEENERTAEFLFTHPVSRTSIIAQKFLALITQIVAMNIIIVSFSAISFAIIGEKINFGAFILLHLAYFILQIEIACLCFGLSAFIRKGGFGIGIGIALLLYFLNIIKNITDSAMFLKYLTPFAYVEASEIIDDIKLDPTLISIGFGVSIVAVVVAFLRYNKKDLAS